jgi:DNA-binding Xre family transcriptional regulator
MATTASKPKPRVSDDAKAKAAKYDGKKIGASLKELRESLRIEPAELKGVGITAQRLTKIETDAKDVTLDELHRLAAAFEYTLGGMVSRVTKGAIG